MSLGFSALKGIHFLLTRENVECRDVNQSGEQRRLMLRMPKEGNRLNGPVVQGEGGERICMSK